jgi:hypothetical protein
MKFSRETLPEPKKPENPVLISAPEQSLLVTRTVNQQCMRCVRSAGEFLMQMSEIMSQHLVGLAVPNSNKPPPIKFETTCAHLILMFFRVEFDGVVLAAKSGGAD